MISISVLLLVSSRVTTSISLLGGMLSSLSSTVMMLLAAFAKMGLIMGGLVLDGAKNMGFVTGGLGFMVTGLGMLMDIRLGIFLTFGIVPVGLTFCLTGLTDTDGGGTDIDCGGADLEGRGVDSGGGGTDISWTIGLNNWRVIMGTKGGGLVKSGGG